MAVNVIYLIENELLVKGLVLHQSMAKILLISKLPDGSQEVLGGTSREGQRWAIVASKVRKYI